MSAESLPGQWEACRFDAVAHVITGKNQKEVESPSGEYPIYGSGGSFGRSTSYLCEAGTTVIGRKGTINSPIFVNERFWNVDTAFGLRPIDSDVLLPRLLYYFCRSFNFAALDKSTTIPSLAKRDIDAITIPLPPLAEQKRIVAKIEELFSELEAGEENLRVARRQLGIYRQSLLKQAFEGKLTRCRKVDLVPLRDLITGLSQGWSPKCELNRTPKLDEWAIIKTTAIQHCRYDDSEAKPLPPPFEPRPSIEIKDGDFLMTRKGPRTRAGVSCYVRKTRPLLMVCDTVYRFRCIEEKVHPLYLELALNSPDVLRAIDRQKAGISESGLSLTHAKIGTVEIPVCSLPEQQEIVRLLDEQFEVIAQNEREIDAALKRSEALRQGILKKAFTGRLVRQDPSDEPASASLARLRTERAFGKR